MNTPSLKEPVKDNGNEQSTNLHGLAYVDPVPQRHFNRMIQSVSPTGQLIILSFVCFICLMTCISTTCQLSSKSRLERGLLTMWPLKESELITTQPCDNFVATLLEK